MVAKKRIDYSGVPTSGELENANNQKKYTINRSPKGDLLISKPVCALMAIGALLLAVLAALLVFLLLPRCTNGAPEALVRLRQAANAGAAVDERLPRSIKPLHYRLRLVPNLFRDNSMTTNGDMTIAINVTENTDKITFHAADMDIDQKSVKVRSRTGSKDVRVTGQSYDIQAQKYTVQLAESLEEGKLYDLDLNFVSKINDHMQGFYKSTYKERGSRNLEKVMASTQFSPTDARRAFPCFDDPSFKATFEITIARPANMSTLSNMPLRGQSAVDTNSRELVWDNYETTPIMSTYLVAFVVSDLQPFRYNSSEKLFTVWSRRDVVDQTRFAIDLGPKLLKYFEDYFSIPFPLKKIDLVAVPDFGFSGMENWGLITFRESALLFDEKHTDIKSKKEIALVMGHEIAHQWFGNLVTPRWWNDLWLKEGFATYLSYLGINNVEPTWNILEEFIFSVTQKAFRIDSFESSRPVSSQVQNNIQIRQSFDDISYLKGAALIRMLKNIVGENLFRPSLIAYLQTFEYSNADRDNLWEMFENQIRDPVFDKNTTIKKVMDSWLLQPGFPVVHAVANHPHNNKLELKQQRFLLTGEVRNGSWYIPVSIATKESPDFDNTTPAFWLSDDGSPVTRDLPLGKWYLLNLKQTGYYIVNYNEENWKALTEDIMVFPPSIRTQLISDSMDLARANLLQYNIPLTLISYVVTRDMDITFVPYLTALEKLEFLDHMLFSTAAYEQFRLFINAAFNFAFTNVGFAELPVNDYITQRIQQLILKWACKESESRCVTSSRFAFRKWIMEGQDVPLNLKEVIYCTSIREGSDMEWNYAYRKYLDTNLPSEKKVLLKALGCATKPWLLSKYLEFILKNDTGIRKQNGAEVFISVAENPAGHQLAFDFLRNNWHQLKEYYGEGFKIISKMVSALPTYMNTPYQLSELQDFRNSNLDTLGTAEQALDGSIEKVRANVAWMKHSFEAVHDWLINFNKHYHQRR